MGVRAHMKNEKKQWFRGKKTTDNIFSHPPEGKDAYLPYELGRKVFVDKAYPVH